MGSQLSGDQLCRLRDLFIDEDPVVFWYDILFGRLRNLAVDDLCLPIPFPECKQLFHNVFIENMHEIQRKRPRKVDRPDHGYDSLASSSSAPVSLVLSTMAGTHLSLYITLHPQRIRPCAIRCHLYRPRLVLNFSMDSQWQGPVVGILAVRTLSCDVICRLTGSVDCLHSAATTRDFGGVSAEMHDLSSWSGSVTQRLDGQYSLLSLRLACLPTWRVDGLDE